ncbi:MAG: MBL fold metallo-hydrolase [Chloroflexi bacterium AL-N10]|nr:MBL fold metallo-hydrolase [Chloroflexi bacterium AL-N1]NOK66722.1 MBL fold metallo-hydrolase [Chloroflexi bacterium AL-N10]NOK72110.1 MBL fold metallo-hydrolase [Chloroflexi bacterium AL-N5]
MDKFIIRFWGVRGSYPVPGQRTVRYGGNTSCIELQLGTQTIILDAGTGIINLGADLVRRTRAAGEKSISAVILFSHMHHDHTQGFPFFEPAYIGTNTLHIFGPKVFENDLQHTLAQAMLPPSFPISLDELASLKNMHNLTDTDVVLIGQNTSDIHIHNRYRDNVALSPEHIHIHTYHSYAHPKNGVHIYRVSWGGKSIVYATDTEGYIETDQRLISFAQDADVLIHDSQYLLEDYADPNKPKQGWGHSTPEMACAVAQASNVQRLILFHHDPNYDDETIEAMERNARDIFPETHAAYEGLELHI